MIEKKYTNGEYLRNNPTWHVEDSSWKAQQIIKMLGKNNLQPKSICEIGCGAGEILNQLYLKMKDDVNFIGYEISPQAYSLCQKRKKDRIQFYLKNILEEKNAFFDLVLLIDVFEHVENYIGFLNGIRQKGTYKLFHIPLDISVQSVLRSSPILNARTGIGHIHYFTKETAISTLNDTGYNIIDYFYTPGSIDLNTGSIKSKIVKLPRNIFFKLNEDLTVRILGGYSLLVLAK